MAEMIKKLQAFNCLNYIVYSLRQVKCEWQEAKQKGKNCAFDHYIM